MTNLPKYGSKTGDYNHENMTEQRILILKIDLKFITLIKTHRQQIV